MDLNNSKFLKFQNDYKKMTIFSDQYGSETFGGTAANQVSNSDLNKIFRSVDDLLTSNRLISSESNANLTMRSENESRITDFSYDDQSIVSAVEHLVAEIGIPQNKCGDAVCATMKLLDFYHNHHNLPRSIGHEHFKKSELSHSFSTDFIAPSVLAKIGTIESSAYESFSAFSDSLMADVKSNIIVTLLKFKTGIITNRVFPRRNTNEPFIVYQIPTLEGYNVEHSMNQSSTVRHNGKHRFWVSGLHKDPSPVSMVLKPVIPLEINDITNSYLESDGILFFNKDVPIVDLTLEANRPGYSNFDFTDVLSEGGRVDSIFVKVTNPAGVPTEKFFKINLHAYDSAKFVPLTNNSNDDASERSASPFVQLALHSTTLDKDGQPVDTTFIPHGSPILGYYAKLIVETSHKLSLREGISKAFGNVRLEPWAKDETIANSVDYTTFVTYLSNFKAELIGYSLDVKFSEENLKKSTIALRSLPIQKTYSIAHSPNYFIDWSLRDSTAPRDVVEGLNQVMQIGIDHRNLEIIMSTLEDVYQRSREEYLNGDHLSQRQRVAESFISGYKVQPTVIRYELDVKTNLKSVRDSDLMSDVRSRAEATLMHITAMCIQESKYNLQLEPGSKTHFKAITSLPIFSSIFATPTIHDHIDKQFPMGNSSIAGGTPSDSMEVTRELPNGVKVTFVIAPYDMVKDKIIMVVYNDNNPESELNFGHNWDYNVFTAQLTPTMNNGAFNRLFANAREFPVITCPVAVEITVKNISAIDNIDFNKPYGNP